jgi:hypothetical protein
VTVFAGVAKVSHKEVRTTFIPPAEASVAQVSRTNRRSAEHNSSLRSIGLSSPLATGLQALFHDERERVYNTRDYVDRRHTGCAWRWHRFADLRANQQRSTKGCRMGAISGRYFEFHPNCEGHSREVCCSPKATRLGGLKQETVPERLDRPISAPSPMDPLPAPNLWGSTSCYASEPPPSNFFGFPVRIGVAPRRRLAWKSVPVCRKPNEWMG